MKKYNVELASGFSLTISAENIKQARAYADRIARGNDTVISVTKSR